MVRNRRVNMVIIMLMIGILSACQVNLELPGNKGGQQGDKQMDKINEQLIEAAKQGNADEVNRLLESGANCNTRNDRGETPVIIATQQNDPETVKVLIEHGADINIRDNNQDNVLLYAGAQGYLDIVKLAIAAEADTGITNRYGGIAIIPAAERGHVEVVEELLVHSDSNVNHINDLHWTALIEAIVLSDGGERHQQIVQLLLEHGADIGITDRDGITPLEHAKKRGYSEIVEMLEEAENLRKEEEEEGHA